MKALSEFTKSVGGDFDDTISTTNPIANISSIVSLTVAGLNDGARRAGNESRYSEDDVWDIFTDAPNLIAEVSNIFLESVVPLTEKLGDISKNANAPAAKMPSRKK